MSKKSKIQEGDVFAVPSLDEPSLRGVIARLDGQGRVLVYFFHGTVPLSPEQAVFICRVDDRALTGAGERPGKGEPLWPVVGRIDGFTRPAWPVPRFYNVMTGKLVAYDDNARHYTEERQATPEEAGVAYDGFFGWLAAEKWLRKKIGLSAPAAA